MKSKLKVVGLTGGIASGKTTVAGFMRSAGVPVMDADRLGHIILEKGTDAFEEVVTAFGKDVLTYAGDIDRQKLGEKVFGNDDRRRQLEAITHPAIQDLAKTGLKMIEERGEPMAIYEAALLVETGAHKALDALIVVSCSLSTQMTRLISRDGLTPGAAAVRIASQFPLAEKLTVADYVIENEGDIDETRTAALNVLEQLKKSFSPENNG